jgi:hypothetical protein
VKGNVAVVLELNNGPIVYALQMYSFVTVYPIHGLTLARYRQAMFPSGAKDDPSDAELALDMMLHYPKKVKPLKPSSDDTRTLNYLVEQRRTLVDDKRRHTNRLINALKQYYPQPLDWFSHRDTELFCDFLIKWPSLQTIKKVRSVTIAKFFKSYGGNAVSNTAKRIDAINTSLPLTEDTAFIVPHQMLVVALCKQVMTWLKTFVSMTKLSVSCFRKCLMQRCLNHCQAQGHALLLDYSLLLVKTEADLTVR